MTKNTPKSTDGLMRYMRDKKGIAIGGSSQKRKLMNMGYYHGYKGYRYIRTPNNPISYTVFSELSAIYDFDSQLKALLYPYVMQIETALKNYVLEVMITEVKTDSFNDIYNQLLDNYKSFSTVGKSFKNDDERKKAEENYKKQLKRRLDLRTRVYDVHSKAYGNENRIVTHYLGSDRNLPIWATFELLSLGEFGNFVSCLNYLTRRKISAKLGVKASDDSNAMLVQQMIYTIKDLRNAIAHNDVAFDTRFRSNSIKKQLISALTNATGISNITFNTIVDYLILIVYLLKLIGISKTEMKRLINSFESITEKLRGEIPASVFDQI
ncbi:MAG: Abi family protein, partial [Firmicutes bacterium]|nr:Abi family protein [Bacillota bacterium]